MPNFLPFSVSLGYFDFRFFKNRDRLVKVTSLVGIVNYHVVVVADVVVVVLVVAVVTAVPAVVVVVFDFVITALSLILAPQVFFRCDCASL